MSGLLDQLRARLFGRDGRAWAGSVEYRLFDGETVRRRVSVGGNRVVVTTHRLLAFTPEADGENYRTVDLPNVTGVSAGHEGETNLLYQALRVFLYGGVLLAVGVVIDFESFVPTDVFGGTGAAAGRLGLGGLIGMMQQFLSLIARIDEFARVIGALLVLFGTFIVGVYLLTRDPVVVVRVAGDDVEDIVVPATDGEEDAGIDAAVTELETELFESGSRSEPTDTAGGSDRDAGFGSDDPL
jgi:hypothetical protein